MVVLRDLRHLRVVDRDVLDDDLDAGVEGFLDHVLERLGFAMGNQDALERQD